MKPRASDHRLRDFALSRRDTLCGALGLATSALVPPVAHAADPAAMGIPEAAPDRAQIVRRMRYRTDAGLVCWWFRGRMYGQQGARLFPLCGMVFGSMIKLSPRMDGGFDTVQYELGFRTDLVTGERIEQLRNPVTGEMIVIPFAPVGPTRLRFSADNVPEVPAKLGGSVFLYRHVPEQFWRAGDTLFLQYQAESVVQTTGQQDRVINDFGMIYGPAGPALDPRVNSAPAWIQGTDVTDYARWLKMPQGSGTQTLRSIGAKVARFEDMPADWIAMVARTDPAMAADPMSVFDRPEATYKG